MGIRVPIELADLPDDGVVCVYLSQVVAVYLTYENVKKRFTFYVCSSVSNRYITRASRTDWRIVNPEFLNPDNRNCEHVNFCSYYCILYFCR